MREEESRGFLDVQHPMLRDQQQKAAPGLIIVNSNNAQQHLNLISYARIYITLYINTASAQPLKGLRVILIRCMRHSSLARLLIRFPGCDAPLASSHVFRVSSRAHPTLNQLLWPLSVCSPRCWDSACSMRETQERFGRNV